MLQKYIISVDSAKNNLKIREYANIDKNPKKEMTSMPDESLFTLLCEENYQSETIMRSIPKGITDLIATLRTHNIFPIGHYAEKIAREVTALYDASADGSVELVFNDKDLVDDLTIREISYAE